MGSVGIIIDAPRLDDPVRHRQATEHVLVEALVAEAAVEAFNEGVLHRLARRDVMPTDASILLPAQHGVGGELAAVVADYHQRLLALRDDRIELACNPAAGDRGVDNQRQALAGEVVDNDEHPKAPTIGQHNGDKVEAPTLGRGLRQGHRRTRAAGSLSSAAAAHRQPLFTVEPEQLLVVQLDAFATQQDVQASITKPSPLAGKGAQPFPHRRVLPTRADIAVGLWRHTDQRAGAPLRIALLVDRPGHDHPPGTGRQKFFPRASRSVATSSIASANSFFSLRFSSPIAFSLRASDTSMPPYFERQ